MRKQCEPFCGDYQTCDTLCNDYSEKAENYYDSLSFVDEMKSDWEDVKDTRGISSPEELHDKLKENGEYEKCVIRKHKFPKGWKIGGSRADRLEDLE